MPAPTLTEEQKAEIITLAKLGFSQKIIAEKCSVTVAQINFLCMRECISLKLNRNTRSPDLTIKAIKRPAGIAYQFTDKESGIVLKMLAEGKKVKDISEALKRNYSSVWYHIAILKRKQHLEKKNETV